MSAEAKSISSILDTTRLEGYVWQNSVVLSLLPSSILRPNGPLGSRGDVHEIQTPFLHSSVPTCRWASIKNKIYGAAKFRQQRHRDYGAPTPDGSISKATRTCNTLVSRSEIGGGYVFG